MIVKSQQYTETSKKLADTRKLKLKEEQKAEEELAKARKNSLLGQIATSLKNTAMYTLNHRMLKMVTQGIKQMIQVTIDYEQSLANTQSVANATEKDLRALDSAARNAGETTRFTASEAAKALYYMASAGYSATESIQALDGTLAMAQATGEDLAQTAEVIAVTLAQFGLAARESDRIANVLTAGIVSSQATMDKLKTSLHQVGPVAAVAGRSIEEVVGILDVMYDSGMQASRAGRAMRNALAELSSPTTKTAKKLAEMGIAFEDIDVTTNSLVDVFGTLGDAGLSVGQIMSSFGKVIGPQMAVVIRAGRTELQWYTDEVTNTNKAFLAAHIQNDTMQGDQYRLKSAWEALSITIMNGFMPAFRSVVQLMFTGIRQFNIWIKRMSGAHTVADDLANTMTELTTQQDEYTRLTSLLNDKTIDLTTSEKKLYEARRAILAQDMYKTLSDMATGYTKVAIEQEKLLDVFNYVAKEQQNQDDYIALAQDIRLKGIDEATAAEKKAFFERYQLLAQNTSTIQNEYSKIYRNADASGKKLLYTLDFNLAQIPLQITKIEDGVASLSRFTGVEEFFTAMADPSYYDALGPSTQHYTSIINITEEDIRQLKLTIGELALTASTSSSIMDESTTETIAQAGRLRAELALTDKHMEFIRLKSPKLADAIEASAQAWIESSKAVSEITAEEYEQIIALQDQIATTSAADKAIQQLNDSMLSNAQDTLTSSSNVETLNSAFALMKEEAVKSANALREQAEAQYEENQALIDGDDIVVGQHSRALLESFALTQRGIELSKINYHETMKLADIERQRLSAIGETTSAELESLLKRQQAYKLVQGVFTDYTQKLIEASQKQREDAIEESYANAKTTADIRKSYMDRLYIISDYRKNAQDELNTQYEKERATYETQRAERDADLKTTYEAELSGFDEYEQARIALAMKAEVDRVAEAERVRDSEYADIKLDDTKNQADKDRENTDILARYDAEVKDAATEREGAVADIEKKFSDERSSAYTRYLDLLGISEKEYTDAVGILYSALTAEQIQLLEYYRKEEKDALKKSEDAEEKRVETFKENIKDTISEIESVFSELDTLFSNIADGMIDDIDRVLDAQIEALDAELAAVLEEKGIADDTEEESLRKTLSDAKEEADEEAVIEAQKALDKYLIEQEYADKQTVLEEEATAKQNEIKYKSALASWYLDSASIASQGVVAIMNAIATGAKMINPVLSALYIGATSAAVAVQAGAHAVTYPQKEDYYESGGIVPGTTNGTQIIAGEHNKTELISNASQMANILSAIGNGGYAHGTTNMTVIIQTTDKREQARYTIEDVLNKGVITINPEKAIRTVLR